MLPWPGLGLGAAGRRRRQPEEL
ncbi:MAG: hypothetical protein LBD90_03090 [Bifidobacteriaceae bacterium]|nr:hypothetical protein [Bifidobacteriaceae bacterium]